MLRENIESAILRRHPLGIAGGALDRHPLAGIDGQRGLDRGVEIAPVNRLGSRPQKFGGCILPWLLTFMINLNCRG